MNLIFVYGTLKSGHSRNHALSSERYVGVARTVDDYAMYSLSGFPGMVKVDRTVASGKKIYGELYEVSDQCLERIDVIEGVSHGMYVREFVDLDEVHMVALPLGRTSLHDLHRKRVQAYIYNRDISDCMDCGVFWHLR